PVLLIIVVAGMLALIFSPAGARMGRTLQLFCLGYGLYLLIFFNPQTSTLRLLLPLFPMAVTLALVRSRGYRAAMLVPMCCSRSCGWPICGTSPHRPIFRRDHVCEGKLPGSTGSWNNRGTTVGAPGVDRLCMTTEGRAHMAAQKPRTGDGPLEVTEEGRSM